MPETAVSITSQIDTQKLLAALRDAFSESELRDLCFELRLEYEDLPPGSKADKARELVQRCERERRLPELAEAILQARPHIPRHSLIRDGRTDQSPFKGLLAFQEEDEAIFYGRETLTTDLLHRLLPSVVWARQLDSSLSGKTNVLPTASPLSTTFLALVGASGSGKSSVVRAGLIPALRRQTDWPIHLLTPTAHPLESLAVTLTRESESVTAVTTLIDDMRRDPRSLHLYVRKLLGDLPNRPTLLLVIDQFEELFTLCKDEAEKRAFVENLVTAVNPDTAGPTIVTLTLRADFYSHCLQFASLHALLEQQQKIVPAMTAVELRTAIEQPAARAGLVFEEGLVDLLLRDVGDEPGNLPLLSHVLLETWQRREGDRLTLAGYTAAGGVHGAIAKTAESTYRRLLPEQQAIARNIFLRLTELGEGVQDTRRRAGLDELLPRTAAAAEVETVLKLLADARLVTTNLQQIPSRSAAVSAAALPPSASEDADSAGMDSAGVGAYAEVSHEALIREWPTLRRWLDDDREGLRIHRQLTEDAAEWERTARDVNYLYRGGRLAQAREWAATPDANLNELEQAFLDAGLAQQQDELAAAKAAAAREAEAARKLRQRAVFLRGALVMAAVLAIVSFLLFGQSSRNANQAQAESTRAFENLAQANIQSTRAFNNEGTAVAEAATAEAAKALAIANEETAQAQATRADENFATAVYNEQLAATREAEANDQRQKALVQSLAALSAMTYERDKNPELALLLGIEAAQLNESSQAGANSLVDNSLRSIMQEYAYHPIVLVGHEDTVYSVAFTPDGQTLASGSADGTIRLWNIDNPTNEPVVIAGQESGVYSLAFSPDGRSLASGSANGTIQLWDMDNLSVSPVSLAGHAGSVYSVSFAPHGQTLASGSEDGTIRLWDMGNHRAEPLVIDGDEGEIWSVIFSPDGQTLASSGFSYAISLWDVNHLIAEPIVLTGHEFWISELAFSPDGQMVASGSIDRTIRLWDMYDPSAMPTVLTVDKQVESIVFAPDGQTLASSSEDGTIQLWNRNNLAAEPAVLAGHEAGVYSLAYSPNGQLLASGSADNTIRLWTINNTGAEPVVLNGHQGPVESVLFVPDHQILASGGENGAILLWDLNNMATEPGVLDGHEGSILSMAYSPNEQMLASSSYGTIRLWDMSHSAVEPIILSGQEGYVWSVSFAPDGQILASGGEDGTIRLWDISRLGIEPSVLTGHESIVSEVVFSPNGQTLASASYDGTIRLWEVDNLTTEPIVLTGHQGSVYSISFSPNGQALASAGADGTIRFWDMGDLATTPVVLSKIGEWWINSVAFSPDGQVLASGSYDGIIWLWSVDNPTAGPAILNGHEHSVNSVAFSPDGQMLASSSYDETIRLWPTLDALVKLGCQQVGRNLNWEEWQRYLPGEPYRQTCSNLPRHPSVPPDA